MLRPSSNYASPMTMLLRTPHKGMSVWPSECYIEEWPKNTRAWLTGWQDDYNLYMTMPMTGLPWPTYISLRPKGPLFPSKRTYIHLGKALLVVSTRVSLYPNLFLIKTCHRTNNIIIVATRARPLANKQWFRQVSDCINCVVVRMFLTVLSLLVLAFNCSRTRQPIQRMIQRTIGCFFSFYDRTTVIRLTDWMSQRETCPLANKQRFGQNSDCIDATTAKRPIASLCWHATIDPLFVSASKWPITYLCWHSTVDGPIPFLYRHANDRSPICVGITHRSIPSLYRHWTAV